MTIGVRDIINRIMIYFLKFLQQNAFVCQITNIITCCDIATHCIYRIEPILCMVILALSSGCSLIPLLPFHLILQIKLPFSLIKYGELLQQDQHLKMKCKQENRYFQKNNLKGCPKFLIRQHNFHLWMFCNIGVIMTHSSKLLGLQTPLNSQLFCDDFEH